jgi:hypothetical protein
MKQLIIFLLILIPVISFSQTGGTDLFLTKTDSLNLPQLKQVTPDSTKVLTVDINGGVGYTYNEGSSVTPDSTWNEATVIDTFYLKDTTAKIYKDVVSGELTFKDSVSGAQKLSELIGGGSVNSMMYQDGGWSAHSSSTAVSGFGIMSTISTIDASSNIGWNDGRYLYQRGSTSTRNCYVTSTGLKLGVSAKPLFVVKFEILLYSGTQTYPNDINLQIGLCPDYTLQTTQIETCVDFIGLYANANTDGTQYFNFLTYDSDGSWTSTSTGVLFDYNSYIFMCEVVSSTEVKFWLYDDDFNLLSSATHTTNIPTGNTMYFMSKHYMKQSTVRSQLGQYFGKIIIR